MRPVCLHMNLLHYTLPFPTNLFKINEWPELKEFFKGKVLFIFQDMIDTLSSPLMQTVIKIYGLVRKYVKLSPFS